MTVLNPSKERCESWQTAGIEFSAAQNQGQIKQNTGTTAGTRNDRSKKAHKK